MTPYYQDSFITLYHGSCFEIIPELEPFDSLITDTPYSARTHKGHNQVEGVEGRRGISYAPWTSTEVRALVVTAHHKCKGWFVAMSDHVLGPYWERELQMVERYVFPPLPFVSKGSRFRMAGDGRASWSTWINVARPKKREFCGWGSLPGAYILPLGEGKSYPVVGGKPDWLGRVLVRDYSKEGQTVVDPCMGGGTFVTAAKYLGRKAIGIDTEEACCELAAKAASRTREQILIHYTQ